MENEIRMLKQIIDLQEQIIQMHKDKFDYKIKLDALNKEIENLNLENTMLKTLNNWPPKITPYPVEYPWKDAPIITCKTPEAVTTTSGTVTVSPDSDTWTSVKYSDVWKNTDNGEINVYNNSVNSLVRNFLGEK